MSSTAVLVLSIGTIDTKNGTDAWFTSAPGRGAIGIEALKSLIVQYDVQERSMDRQLAVVLNESHLAEAVHEEINA